MKQLIFDDFVDDDINAIYVDYENKQPGLGERFLRNLHSLMKSIKDNPQSYGRIYATVRAGKVRRFQHVVYFRMLRSGDCLVFAVRHGRENPRVWKDRYRGRP